MFCSVIAEDKKATGSDKQSLNKRWTANQQTHSKMTPLNRTSQHYQALTNQCCWEHHKNCGTHTHFIWDSARHCGNHLTCHEICLLSEHAISTDTQKNKQKKCTDDSSNHNDWVASESEHHNSWIKQCQVTSHRSNTTSARAHLLLSNGEKQHIICASDKARQAFINSMRHPDSADGDGASREGYETSLQLMLFWLH